MKFPTDKKTPIPYDKKPVKGNTLDYYNDDMSRKAVGRLFDDGEESRPVTKPADDSPGLEGSAEYIDLDELETYIQKKHVNISSVYDDTGEAGYDISMYQDKKKEKPASTTSKSSTLRTPSATPASTLKPAMGAKQNPGLSRTSTLKRPPTRPPHPQDSKEAGGKAGIIPFEINNQIKVAALVMVVVFIVILAALVYKMNSLSSDLKIANEHAALYNPDTERELTELRIQFSGLQEQNDMLQKELDFALASGTSDSPTNVEMPPPNQGNQPTIPSTGQSTTQPQGERTHTVVGGDTLSKISSQYYGSSDFTNEIMRANNMTNSSIWPGDVLKIPEL